MKECFKCKETKPLSEFYKHEKMADGHVNKCKECNKKDVSKNYRNNIEYYKLYERNRLHNPERVAARIEYANSERGKLAQRRGSNAWRERNPHKVRAINAVNNAVRDGRLIHLPCEKCFNTHDIQAHHDDYDKPLEVRWLCIKCHSEHHKEQRLI